MEQGSGHSSIDGGGPKESKNANFFFYHYLRFWAKIPSKITRPGPVSPLKSVNHVYSEVKMTMMKCRNVADINYQIMHFF